MKKYLLEKLNPISNSKGKKEFLDVLVLGAKKIT
jgi:hypothetical protein